MPSKLSSWRVRLGAISLALVLVVLALGFAPVTPDLPRQESTAGAALGPDSAGGLQKPFPAMRTRTENPFTPERAALGRLLFFDPIVSGSNDMSCATCHHPDLGFTDGRARSMGFGGKGVGPDRQGGRHLPRAAPTLWNAAFNHLQFWDGRAKDLEEQAARPIQDPNEMNQDPGEVVRELRALPEYARLFDKAFGGREGSGVTFENVTHALASFERTLLSQNSPFDRFAAGDYAALTPSQRRGFNLFRSGTARCFECHGLPTFSNPDFKVIGVPDAPGLDPDRGRAAIAGGSGYDRAFKVPTLRNVALTAPYMHNGVFATLEDVIDFYSNGGGSGVGLDLPNLDDKIRRFRLTSEEKADLVAFLHSLTDEGNLPEVPQRVPSGLPVHPRLENPRRKEAEKLNAGTPEILKRSQESGTTIEVRPGESIQEAVFRTRPGDTVLVYPGTYPELVAVDVPGITLKGITEGGRKPVLEGGNRLSDAVLASGNDFTIEGFVVRNYTGNGVVVQGARNVTFRDLALDNTGLYGVYPVSCSGVLVESVSVTKVRDAGIYVGQSRDIVVRNSEARGNVTGIEIENSVNALVENNLVEGNTGGILVFLLPNNPSKVGRSTRVIGNRVVGNNTPNFADPKSIVANVMPGTGILIMAADETEVSENEVRDNDTYGIAVISLRQAFPADTEFDVGATPERNWIHDNRLSGNGRSPDPRLTARGLPGADLLWDGSGWDNLWSEKTPNTFPRLLPGPRWPDFTRRLWWRILAFAAAYL